MLSIINSIVDNTYLTNTQIADQNKLWHVFSSISFNNTSNTLLEIAQFIPLPRQSRIKQEINFY
jgi:hypothetical protein